MNKFTKEDKILLSKFLYPTDECRKFVLNDLNQELNNLIDKRIVVSSENIKFGLHSNKVYNRMKMRRLRKRKNHFAERQSAQQDEKTLRQKRSAFLSCKTLKSKKEEEWTR